MKYLLRRGHIQSCCLVLHQISGSKLAWHNEYFKQDGPGNFNICYILLSTRKRVFEKDVIKTQVLAPSSIHCFNLDYRLS